MLKLYQHFKKLENSKLPILKFFWISKIFEIGIEKEFKIPKFLRFL